MHTIETCILSPSTRIELVLFLKLFCDIRSLMRLQMAVSFFKKVFESILIANIDP